MNDVRTILEAVAAKGFGIGVMAGNLQVIHREPLPAELHRTLADHKPELVAALTRKGCRELGRVLRDDEMRALGVDPASCGCGGKIRRCEHHGGFCTTMVPKAGFRLCAACEDHDG